MKKLILYSTIPEEAGRIDAIQEMSAMEGIMVNVQGNEAVNPFNFYIANGQVRARPKLKLQKNKKVINNLPSNAKVFDGDGELDVSNGRAVGRKSGTIQISAWPYLEETVEISSQDLE